MRTQSILFNGKKNIIWGCGNNGKKLLLSLLHQNIHVDCFCDSDIQKQDVHLLNKKVISPDEIVQNKENYNILISVGREQDAKEIVDYLTKNGVNNYLTWKDLVTYTYINPEFELETLYKVIRDTQNKQVIIYGADRKGFALKSILELLDIRIKYIVDVVNEESVIDNILVKSVYDLIEEDVEETFILIIGSRGGDKAVILEKLGFHFYTNYNYMENYLDTGAIFYLDPHLGHNYVYDSPETPGIMKWGGDKDDLIIVTSGGSTTDGYQYKFKSWPQILYEILQKNGYKVTVINAACGSYKSAQELIKLQRDIIPYQPDIVLSYTGVNDSWDVKEANIYPFVHYYQHTLMEEASKYVEMLGTSQEKGYVLGVKHNLNKEQRLVKNIQIMNAVCKEFQIKFHSFLLYDTIAINLV